MVRFVSISVVMALLGAAVGYGIYLYGLGGTPKVAVMNGPLIVTDFDEGVIEFELANALEIKLDFVANDPDIKAVVIRMSSPGGEVTSSERLFSRVASLREEKPVVVSAQWLLASGAYMMSLGANYVFASPGTNVGSIGVIGFVFPRLLPSEFEVGTGPSKTLGPSERTDLEELELLKEGFYRMVQSQRGDRLRLSKEELLEGRTWLGVRALQLGLVDELGAEMDAIRKSAELAGLKRYRVVQVEDEMERAGGVYAAAVDTARDHRADPDLFSVDTQDSKERRARDFQARSSQDPQGGPPIDSEDPADLHSGGDSDELTSHESESPSATESNKRRPRLYYLYLPPELP